VGDFLIEPVVADRRSWGAKRNPTVPLLARIDPLKSANVAVAPSGSTTCTVLLRYKR
jgi:hypothetical protein